MFTLTPIFSAGGEIAGQRVGKVPFDTPGRLRWLNRHDAPTQAGIVSSHLALVAISVRLPKDAFSYAHHAGVLFSAVLKKRW